MYNLAMQIAVMSGNLDGDKKGSLGKIQTDASNVLSLSSTIGLRGTPGNTMDSIPERSAGSAGPQDEDDLGVFKAEDIQSVLRQMNYMIDIPVIVNKFDETHGYLKFVQRENELKVLRYLSEIKSSSNHTISGVQFWPVQGSTVISMPVAGGWLTLLDDPSDQLWSVAKQLVEGVAFMHEHNVAHMDLKPQNVIIPVAGGRLSIIDFSVSIRVPSPDATYNGVAGTEDYIAPEVRKGNYKPMLADLWKLCGCCHPSADRTTLLKIAKRLMNHDPEARPKMSDMLEQMAPTQRRGGNAAPSTLPYVEV
ncbi:kinase-like protein [Tylopilus felleus]